MQPKATPEAPDLAGLRVLIVEDESLVAMQLEDMLIDFGCNVVGLAMRVKRAKEMLETDPELGLDLAILDVNIGGEQVYPVAEILSGRNTPMVFATGYGRSGVVAEWQGYPVLQKPYTSEQVADVMALALKGSG